MLPGKEAIASARITLVEPRAPHYHVFSSVRLPRLGLVTLATELARRGHQARVWCQAFGEVPAFELLRSDLVGLSVTTSTAPEAYRLARLLRHQGVTVVLGGPHVTFLPEEGLEVADYVLRGEAEATLSALVDCLTRGEDWRWVPGLSYREGGSCVHNPLPPPVEPDALARPDLGVLQNAGRLSLHPMLTSRGCPHECTFCGVTAMFGRRYRFRAAEAVVAELAACRGRRVFFYDDNFTASPSRAREILRLALERRAVPRAWMAQVRVEAARDAELLRLMARTNCRMVHVGLESVNPGTLRSFRKGQGVEDVRHCIRAFHRHGIAVHGMFVLGGDEDTVETVEETVAFARAERLDTAQFMVLTPLPGTTLFADLERQGRLLTRDWSRYDGHHVVHLPARMTPQELQAATVRAFARFYGLGNAFLDFLTGRPGAAGYKLMGRYILGRWLAHHPDLEAAVGPAPRRRFRLEGLLDAETLARLTAELRTALRAGQRQLEIQLADLELPSEQTFGRLIRFLDGLAARPGVSVRLLGLGARLENMVMAMLARLPRFDCVRPDEA